MFYSINLTQTRQTRRWNTFYVVIKTRKNVASIYIPSKVTGKSQSAGTFCSFWRVPIKGNFVLSGLIRRLVFWQHHEANSSGLRLFFELPRRCPRLRACLHGGGGPQIGEVTCGGSPHLSCKRDQIEMRDYVDRWVTHQSGFPHPPGVPHLYVNRPWEW